MEDNEDEPDDVKRARPVEEEIRKGEIDEYSGKPVKPLESKGRAHHRCEKNVGKKMKGKSLKSEGDECCRTRKAKAARAPKTATVLEYEKECTLPKIKAIPRHCLTKEEWIDILATPSRKCPSPCLRKEVTRRLRPVSPRMAELAQPPKNRLLNTLESRAGTLPTELIDNLIQTLEGETCLTPEQAEQMFRDRDNRAKKKCRKKKSKLKCGGEKFKNSETGGVTSNVLPFDKEAVNCQYIMAEGFVRSILDWKCHIPREEFKDIAEVILKRLGFILDYNLVNGEDRKSQQMRFLADIIGSWISGVLFEVAETRREQLDEECDKRRKEEEEEETEDDSDDETEEDFDFGGKGDDDEDEDDDKGDERKKKYGGHVGTGGKDDERRRKKKGDEDGKEDDDEGKKKPGTKGGAGALEDVDDSAGKVEKEEKRFSPKTQEETDERPEDESRDEGLEDENILRERREKELDEAGKKKDVDDQGKGKDEPGKVETIIDKDETIETGKEKNLQAEDLPVTTETDREIEKRDDEEPLKDTEGIENEEKGEIDHAKSLVDSTKTIEEESGGVDEEATGVKIAATPDEESAAMATVKKTKLSEEETPEIGRGVAAVDKTATSPEESAAMAAAPRMKLGEEEIPETAESVAAVDEMAASPEEKEREIDRRIASTDKMDDSLQPLRMTEGAEILEDRTEIPADSIRAASLKDTEKVSKDLTISAVHSAIQIAMRESQDPMRQVKEDDELKKMAAPLRSVDELTKISGEPEVLEISKKLSKLMGKRKYRTDTPFVTFDKIFHTIYNAIEDSDENPGTDPISNRIHRAVYEKFSSIVQEENPGPLAELTRDVIDVMSGKIALWLRKILTDSQLKFVNKFPASVESADVREWTQWISSVSDTADDWSAWIRNTIKQAENMRAGKVTRGDYRDWTESVDTDAARWRRFHLESIHLAHQHLTMMRDRQVVKTGTRRLTDYNEDKDENEREIKITDLEVERRSGD